MTEDALVPLMLELDGQPPFLLLDVLRAHLAARVDAVDVELWLSDYEELTLSCFHRDGASAEGRTESIEHGPRGKAYRAQGVLHADDDGCRVHVPVTIRAERIGVLDLRLGAAPDARTTSYLRALGSALGYVLLAARRYTDVFETARRRRDLELPAEMQWDLLPVLAHDGPDFKIAGRLEPAYDIGGDNFDYAVDGDGIVVSVTDAMGHGTAAALMSTLVVGVQRNTRRRGDGLRQQARAMNTVVHDQFRGDAFATGLLLRIGRDSGRTLAVNAGHGAFYLLRDGEVGDVVLAPDLPYGLFPDAEYHVHELRMAPQDRLVLVSDGILEAAPEAGGAFGEEGLAEAIRDTADASPSEMVRRLTTMVMEHRAGFLRDDATAVCLDYRR